MTELPDFKEIPKFATIEEADAWLAERENLGNRLAELALTMEEYHRTFQWWAAGSTLRVGHSRTRMANGKWGWAVVDIAATQSEWATGLIEHGQCRLRREANAEAIARWNAIVNGRREES